MQATLSRWAYPETKAGDKLEAALSARPPSRPRKKHAQREHSRYDQALFSAKKDGKLVSFTLAQDCQFTDEDGDFSCHIMQVDKFDIEVAIQGERGTRWIKKSAIMATRVAQ